MRSDDGPAAFSYACALKMEESVSVAPHNVVLTYPRADRISLPIPLGKKFFHVHLLTSLG